ncbi:hypothetical protein DES53_12141 [Roseimicrobium gellanilyticum]|uniref:Uncharacterized protein n=1 Tax=Roseimicrobium gellanilyticum TaxID=748857 RepID=A0A366H195_9BACT|nr:hypothetical protein [Roseimicrobium gellanilyticum]RBP35521.1 hypothetical protein DES53_12141 [Roseimicrobium gellanilyticum]
MTRQQLEHLAYQVREIRARLESPQSVSSLQEALFLAHKFQQFSFNTEQYRLEIEPVIMGIDRLMDMVPEIRKKGMGKFKEEQQSAVQALTGMGAQMSARLESVAPW